jgi:hypothetical protein
VLYHHALKQCADLTLCLASLRHRLREPSEQSCRRGCVLACPGEAWESVVVLDDSPMRVAGTHAHIIMVLCNLMVKHRVLLLQMESCGFELLLLLPQLVHTRVGQDLCVRRSPTPIGRIRGSPIPPMRGAIVGTLKGPNMARGG